MKRKGKNLQINKEYTTKGINAAVTVLLIAILSVPAISANGHPNS